MKLLLFLALGVAYGAGAAPFLSPKHASAPKSARMARAGRDASEPPRLPMKAYHRNMQSENGTQEFTAQALQPANQSVLFEFSTDMTPDSWVGLTFFPAYPYEQQVFTGLTTYENRTVIRARSTIEQPPGGMARMVTSGRAIWTNPKVRGVRAWRGVR